MIFIMDNGTVFLTSDQNRNLFRHAFSEALLSSQAVGNNRRKFTLVESALPSPFCREERMFLHSILNGHIYTLYFVV
jgi:hypothetical protein